MARGRESEVYPKMSRKKGAGRGERSYLPEGIGEDNQSNEFEAWLAESHRLPPLELRVMPLRLALDLIEEVG